MVHSIIQSLQSPVRKMRMLVRKSDALLAKFDQDGHVYYEESYLHTPSKFRPLPIPSVIARLCNLFYERGCDVKFVNSEDDINSVVANTLCEVRQWPVNWTVDGAPVTEFAPKILDDGSVYELRSYTRIVWIYLRYTDRTIQCLVIAGDSVIIRGDLHDYETSDHCDWLMSDDDYDAPPLPDSVIDGWYGADSQWDFHIHCTAMVSSPIGWQLEWLIERGIPDDFMAEMLPIVAGSPHDAEIQVTYEGRIVDARHSKNYLDEWWLHN